MSTANTPVHVYVDEMTIHGGPGNGKLLFMALQLRRHEGIVEGFIEGDFDFPKVQLTVSTMASSRLFNRTATLTEIENEYESFLDSPLPDVNPLDWAHRPTGQYKFKGHIGDWYFTGTYNPQTRKGTLKEDVYDTEAEAELNRLDGLEQEAIRQRGGL